MKIAILEVFKKSFFVIDDRNMTVVAVKKSSRIFKRKDGLYWLNLDKKEMDKHFKHFALSDWKPTAIKDIFTLFY